MGNANSQTLQLPATSSLLLPPGSNTSSRARLSTSLLLRIIWSSGHEPPRDLPTSYLPLNLRFSSTAHYPQPHTNHTMSRSRSDSATSSVSNKELPADSMAIQVTISGGKSEFAAGSNGLPSDD